jgi:hypothetical protein
LQAGGGNTEWLMRFMGYTDSRTSWMPLSVQPFSADSARGKAHRLPDFSVRDGPIHVGVTYQELGCQGDSAAEWYCYAYRCLAANDEAYREACLEIADYLQTKQREEAEGRAYHPSGYEADLLKKYPKLKTFPDQ